ncbi:MAG: hypothetical protein ACFB10_14415 [Salibacteraceae bacterium]
MIWRSISSTIGLSILLLFLLGSCEIINPEEEIPAYIRIDSIDLRLRDANREGAASERITDAWVFVNDELIGAFELPVDVPVLKNEVANVKISAGILNNGISASRVRYPFYDVFELSEYEFVPGEVQTINPVVNYFEDLDFTWDEDFEDISVAFDSMPNSDVRMDRTQDVALILPTPEGDPNNNKSSGIIRLNETTPNFEATSTPPLVLPKGGTEVYLEMDYNISTRMLVGMQIALDGIEFVVPIIDLNPTEDDNGNFGWNKTYIHLTPAVSSEVNASTYRLWFRAAHNPDQAESVLLLDNLKIIHP